MLYQVMYNLNGAIYQKDHTNVGISTDVFYQEAFYQLNAKAKPANALSLELCDNMIAIIHGFIAFHMVDKIRSGSQRAELVFIHSLKRFIHSIKTP